MPQSRQPRESSAAAAAGAGASPQVCTYPVAAGECLDTGRPIHEAVGSAVVGALPGISSGMDLRDRDVLPLPLGPSLDAVLVGATAFGGSSGQRRKARRQRAVEDGLRSGIAALNVISAVGRKADEAQPLSGIQRSAVEHLVTQFAEEPPIPKGFTDNLGAWKALQGSTSGYDDDAGRTHIGFEQGKVSLPAGRSGTVDLFSVLAPPQQNVLESGGLWRDEAEARDLQDELGHARYLDPRLRDHPSTYGAFLGDLVARGVVERCHAPREHCGCFFVKKKTADTMRMIFDTRMANCWFSAPSSFPLASAEALTSIECHKDDEVHMIGADLEVAFYQFALPAELRAFFCLPGVAARHLPSSVRQQLGSHNDDDTITFCARVVPMGWSWATYFVQHAGLHLLHQASDAQWLYDRLPGGALRDRHLRALYIDNYMTIGLDRDSVQASTQKMVDAFDKHGLRSVLDDDGDNPEFLGFVLDRRRKRWRLKAARYWRLRLACRHVLTGAPVTGKEIERLLGHIVSAMMLKRDALCMVEKLYTFVQCSREKRQPLWPSALQEVRWVHDLLPCLTCDTTQPWADQVFMYDASPWGFGVGSAWWQPGQAATTGRLSERARFRGLLASDLSARHAALEEQEHTLSATSAADLLIAGHEAGFTEVRRTDASEWSVAFAGRWHQKCSQAQREARARTLAIRHISRIGRLASHRILLLGDNIGVVCAGCKGRAQTGQINFQLRACFGTLLAANLRIYDRWLPSELNHMDAASRLAQPNHGPSAMGWTVRSHTAVFPHGGAAPGAGDRLSEFVGGRRACKGRSAPRRFAQSWGMPGRCAPVGESRCHVSRPGHAAHAGRAMALASTSEPDPAKHTACLHGRAVQPAWRDRETQSSSVVGARVGCLPAGRGLQTSGTGHRDGAGQSHGHGAPLGHATARETLADRPAFDLCRALRMAPIGPHVLSPSGASDGDVGHSRRDAWLRRCVGGARGGDPLRDVPSAKRVVGALGLPDLGPRAGLTHRGPCRHMHSGGGARGLVEDGRLRQHSALGLGQAQVARQTSVDPAQCVRQERPRLPDGARAIAPQLPPRGRNCRGDWAVTHAVRPPPRGRIARPRRQRQRPACSTGPGALALHGHPAPLREERPPPDRARPPPAADSTPASALGGTGARMLRAALRKVVALHGHKRIFLHLFSGGGGLTDAVIRHGVPSINVDVAVHPALNIMNDEVMRVLTGWVSSGIVGGLWSGTPCNSFSSALRGGPTSRMPQQLRSAACPAGLPHITDPKLLAKIHLGNGLASRARCLLTLAEQRAIPSGEENPWSSHLWALPSRADTSAHKDYKVDYCSYGTPYRARTRLRLHSFTWTSPPTTCTGRQRCAFSGRPHEQLTGVDPKSRSFKTKQKQVYPARLCSSLGRDLAHAILHTATATAWNIIAGSPCQC